MSTLTTKEKHVFDGEKTKILYLTAFLLICVFASNEK